MIQRPDGPAAYLITKGFHFLGQRFRHGGFSHAAVLLFRRGAARFEHLLDEPADALDMEVHERLLVDGAIGRLATPLVHEDFKGLEAYIDRHNRYSTWEAKVRFQDLSGDCAARWRRAAAVVRRRSAAAAVAQAARDADAGRAVRCGFCTTMWRGWDFSKGDAG